MKISLSAPDITQREIDLVVEVVKSGRLSIGPKIEILENMFRDYFGVKHAIGVNSGTSGLHLLVRALNIRKDDEVITTPFSFIASTNCFLYEGAKPVFVDINPNTLDMDINEMEEKITKKTKGILPVDVFGHPMDMKKINDISNKYDLKVIEDCCEAIGAEYNGIKSGILADGSVFAFYPNKQITTGEGGMIITDNDEVAELCKSMRSQGRAVTGLWLHHERIGYNYRMSELNAAIGVAQMERLDNILKKRQAVADLYNERLQNINGVRVPCIGADVTKMSWFVYVIRLDINIDREAVMNHLSDSGIDCKPYFTPIHLQPYMRKMFGFKEGDFPITETISKSTIALPFHNHLNEEQIDYVVDTLSRAIKKYRR